MICLNPLLIGGTFLSVTARIVHRKQQTKSQSPSNRGNLSQIPAKVAALLGWDIGLNPLLIGGTFLSAYRS